ncbi:hypothetical protein GCM10010269_83220 [Streptomyces humidus]|uniref:Uncharacterized protein n=1 Tax=Streptomyces humidus TaxID=52259 RepID=A0A918LDH7_9ACTN|nr:hypothetical protein GCM10010269_83220 [Streptomyces humidus]
MSSSACSSLAITGIRLPPAEASSIIARGYRTELVLPRRTICCSFSPSWSVNLRTRTGSATAPPSFGSDDTPYPTAPTVNPVTFLVTALALFKRTEPAAS